MNITQNTILAQKASIASSFGQKALGLLGKKNIHPQEALFFANCRSIHTFFMRFSIDVLFVDSSNKVLKIIRHLRPFKVALGPWKATGVWEFQAGILQNNVIVGDILQTSDRCK